MKLWPVFAPQVNYHLVTFFKFKFTHIIQAYINYSLKEFQFILFHMWKSSSINRISFYHLILQNMLSLWMSLQSHDCKDFRQTRVGTARKITLPNWSMTDNITHPSKVQRENDLQIHRLLEVKSTNDLSVKLLH